MNSNTLKKYKDLYYNLENLLVEEEPGKEDEDTAQLTPKEKAEVDKIAAETEKIRSETEIGRQEVQSVGEAEGDIPDEDPKSAPATPPVADPPMTGSDPSMGGIDAGMGDLGGMNAGMGGLDSLGMDEKIIKSPAEIGRIYELKKIYFRLASLKKILTNSTDTKLNKLSKIVNDAFDILKIVTTNIESYKEQIDRIIIDYTRFIIACIAKLEPYYHKQYQKHQNE